MEQKEKQRPNCPLIGANGNIFNLIGIAVRTLRRNGMKDEAAEMQSRVMHSGSYDEALAIICEYVNPTSVNDEEESECQTMCGM